MPIRRLLQGSGLAQSEVERLCTAYEDALDALQLIDRNDAMTDLVAKKIIAVHQAGVSDAAEISKIAIEELGGRMAAPQPATHSKLRVLIVEDEYYIATDLAAALESIGAAVVGLCGDLDDALEQLASTEFDAAIVDINLRDHYAFPVADRLQAQGIPFLFATGYGEDFIPARFSHVIRCEKPFDDFRVAREIVRLCANQSRPQQ